jgi:hypothetical protein
MAWHARQSRSPCTHAAVCPCCLSCIPWARGSTGSTHEAFQFGSGVAWGASDRTSPNGATLSRAVASRNAVHIVDYRGAQGEPMVSCGPLRRGSSTYRRHAHSTSYVQANLKAEEGSEGKHGMASCRILVALRKCCALRRADARLPSGDARIALVTRGLPSLSPERGEGTARNAADVARSIPEKSPAPEQHAPARAMGAFPTLGLADGTFAGARRGGGEERPRDTFSSSAASHRSSGIYHNCV